MSKLTFDITMSLDGFIAGPNQTLQPAARRGRRPDPRVDVRAGGLPRAPRQEGGETNADAEVLEESVTSTGAVLMGRRMFSGGAGPWVADSNADGWWGDDPPSACPVFVLTHHARETVTKQGGTSFTFVTDGAEAALKQARAAAGDKNISVAGGADVVQQYLTAGPDRRVAGSRRPAAAWGRRSPV